MVKRLVTYLSKIHPLVYILLFLLLGWFYWFQIRPTLAKKECAKFANKLSEKYLGHPNVLYSKEFDGWYKVCLRNKGL